MVTKSRTAKPATSATPSESIVAGAEFVRDRLEKSMENYAALMGLSKEAMDAWIRSATAASKGFESINTEALVFTRQSMDEAVKTVKHALTAKSVEDFVAVQSDFARSALDTCVNQSTRMGELVTDTAREVIEPFQAPFRTVETGFPRQAA